MAIARAIVAEPPLVLMDEPLSNLDAKLRLEMRAEVRRIHTMLGCSPIYVTHDQEEALSLADRILVIIDGQTRQIATPEEQYSRLAHADVAEFRACLHHRLAIEPICCLSVSTSHAMARRNFPGKQIVMLLFLLALLVPPITYGIPMAAVLYQAHLNGTIWGVVLANLALCRSSS